MDKLKFVFKVKAAPDGKTNWIAITSIITPEENVFVIPDDLQPAALHGEITKLKEYTAIKNALKKRHQTRSIWIKMSNEIKAVYCDEMENIMFKEQYLEESSERRVDITASNDSEDPIVKILQKLVENQEKSRPQNVRKTAEKFVLEKFEVKATSAQDWLQMFEKECTRFDIKENENKIEILRLFLEKSGTDWYTSMMMKFGLQSDWSTWKENFVETFANKGWTSSRYAISFKYQQGSLLEYAIKKEKLLIQSRKTIDQGTLIDIIAAGLPMYIIDKIDKEEILTTPELFNELGKLEHLVSKKPANKLNNNEIKTAALDKKIKCNICEKLKNKIRYQPEDKCFFKAEYEKKQKENNIKLVNNSVIEAELQSEESKNW